MFHFSPKIPNSTKKNEWNIARIEDFELLQVVPPKRLPKYEIFAD